MKVIEHIQNAKEPLISFEIIPPRRGGSISGLLHVIEEIAQYRPPFIDITSHSAEVQYEETKIGLQKKVKRKRPGTLGICALIQHKFNIDAVPHILCRNFTREETEDFLIELHYLGIQNILAIRGDDTGYAKPVPEGRTVNEFASDLVKQISNMNQGRYLEEALLDPVPTNFCIGSSGYPEKHYEAPNLKSDILATKLKIDSGADYIVTQMFYDNDAFFRYAEACKNEGISAPVIPGLKVLTQKSHLTTIPKNFFINIPVELSEEVQKASNDQVIHIGVEWAAKQCEELLNKNVPAIHFYIMQNARPIKLLMERLGLNKKFYPTGK